MSTNPLDRHRGPCPVTGKRSYETRALAKKAAHELGPALQAFLCIHCDLFHIGHRGTLTREQHRTLAFQKLIATALAASREES